MEPKDLWKYLLVVVIALAGILHSVFPRFEWRTVGNDGTIVVYDRWTGSFQRAAWDDKGSAKASEPFKAY
jgi:hypothetical protein